MITWNEVEKDWPKFKSKVQTKWNKLTTADLDKIKGKQSQLVDQLEARYDVTEVDAKKQIDQFLKAQVGATKK